MDRNQNKYFGIQFPENCRLSDSEKKALAEKLFLSPTTDVDEVLNIVNDTNMLNSFNQLMEAFKLELVSVSSSEDEEVVINEDDYNMKIYRWKEKIGLPEENELLSILENKDISAMLREAVGNLMYEGVIASMQKPIDYANYIKRWVKGQDDAVEDLSIVLYDHKLRRENDSVELPQSSILFIGNTGNGKSYMLNRAKDIIDIPDQRINCGDIVPAGIRGNNINEYLTYMYLSCSQDTSKTSKGMLVFDEFDKLANHHNSNLQHDFGSSLQQEILRFFDKNETVEFPEDFGQTADMVKMPVKDLLIVFSGAFVGLEEIIQRRLVMAGVPIPNNSQDLLKFCVQQDLIEYGFMPELVSRISQISVLNNLRVKNYVEILKNNADSDLQKHFNKCKLMQIDLTFDEGAIYAIAAYLLKNNLTIRFANTLLNKILKPIYMQQDNNENIIVKISRREVMDAIAKMHYVGHAENHSARTQRNLGGFNIDEIDDFLDNYKN